MTVLLRTKVKKVTSDFTFIHVKFAFSVQLMNSACTFINYSGSDQVLLVIDFLIL